VTVLPEVLVVAFNVNSTQWLVTVAAAVGCSAGRVVHSAVGHGEVWAEWPVYQFVYHGEREFRLGSVSTFLEQKETPLI